MFNPRNVWSQTTMYSPLFILGWTRQEYWEHQELKDERWYLMNHDLHVLESIEW